MTSGSERPSDDPPVGSADPAIGSLMTFNIARGASGPAATGPDDLGRVAAVVAAEGGVDVACLQEVHAADVPVLVDALGAEHGLVYRAHFTASVPEARMRASLVRARDGGDGRRAARLEGRQSDYGIAVLTRGPLTEANDLRLPDDGREPRVAQHVATTVGGRPVTVVNTHLGLVTDRRLIEVVTFRPSRQQAQTGAFLALAGGLSGPVLAAGDLNQDPAALSRSLAGRSLRVASDPSRPTCGRRALDHVLVSADVDVRGAEVREVAISDHDPVVVRFAVRG